MGFVHDRPQGWVEESWKLLVYCSVYRLEVRRFAQTTEEQKRESERLLNGLLLMFESYEHYEVSEALRDICVHYDEMFAYPNGRTDVPLHVIGEEVEQELRFRAQTGSLVIYEDNDRWWERLPPPEVTTPPRRDPPRVIPREPPPPVEKTWFAAQFVDESGLWIDGLSVTMKVGGTSHTLTTDKAGVVELREQTHSTAKVWVADIPQAEKILVDRLDRLDEAPTPTGPDVVGYPVQEPAKNVVLSAGTPRTIVLGLTVEETWFEVRVVDDVGEPIAGLEMAFSVNGQSLATTDADGVVRLEGDLARYGSIGVNSVEDLREKLRSRWKHPREPRIPGHPNRHVLELSDELGTVRVQAELPALIVITPWFRCCHVAGAHFAFGRSFVLREAFSTLSDVARDLQGTEARKAMVFGHTDRSGSEQLNKELSERRAKTIHALLTHDCDAWEALWTGSGDSWHWREQWDTYEAQHMLNTLEVTDDAGVPLEEDGKHGDSTIQGIKRFQKGDYGRKPAEQLPLPVTGWLNRPTRREMFLAYAKLISRSAVPPDRFSAIGDSPFMGCGEYNPLSEEANDAESRRVVLLVFDPAAEPQDLPCQLRELRPCQGMCAPIPAETDETKPPFRCAAYQEVALRCPHIGGGARSHDFIVRIPYPLQQANQLPHVFVLRSEDGTILQRKSAAIDTRAGEDDMSELWFTDLPETQSYTLTCEAPEGPHTVICLTPYEELPEVASEQQDDVAGLSFAGQSEPSEEQGGLA